jgi:hypothetical protein
MANSIKDLLEFATKVRAGLPLQQPIHSGTSFGFRRFQIHQVAQMRLNASLRVHRCVKLQVDLVQATDDVQREAPTVAFALQSLLQSVRQPEIHQGRRTEVQPFFFETQFASDLGDQFY